MVLYEYVGKMLRKEGKIVVENDENTTYGAGGGKNNVDTLNKRVYGSV